MARARHEHAGPRGDAAGVQGRLRDGARRATRALKTSGDSTPRRSTRAPRRAHSLDVAQRRRRFRPSRAVTRVGMCAAMVTGARVPQYVPTRPASWTCTTRRRCTSSRARRRAPGGAFFPDAVRGGTFRPDDGVTRLVAAIVLVRAAGLEAEATAPGAGMLFGVTDAASIPSVWRGHVAVARSYGLVPSGSQFNPNGAFTRADLRAPSPSSRAFRPNRPRAGITTRAGRGRRLPCPTASAAPQILSASTQKGGAVLQLHPRGRRRHLQLRRRIRHAGPLRPATTIASTQYHLRRATTICAMRRRLRRRSHHCMTQTPSASCNGLQAQTPSRHATGLQDADGVCDVATGSCDVATGSCNIADGSRVDANGGCASQIPSAHSRRHLQDANGSCDDADASATCRRHSRRCKWRLRGCKWRLPRGGRAKSLEK